MKILADATLPGLVTAFPKPFELTLYHEVKDLPHLLKNQDILLCRSTLKVTKNILNNTSLSYVATASSGTDHIDDTYLKRCGIELIDAKGSNAPAVADYVIATLAFLEKYKGFQGTKAAVIGVGEVGLQVAKRLEVVGMNVLRYDPPKSQLDNNFISCSFDEVIDCDLITIHANLHASAPYPSLNLINDHVLKKLKPHCVIINASRGGIVNESDLLHQNQPLTYCTDVYGNEPSINPKIVKFASLCTPHIAGHSLEAKDAAVTMVSQKLHKAYNLASPKPTQTTIHYVPEWTGDQTWQDYVLSLYNPVYETEILKKATDLELTFLNLRKAHQNRHDFAVYASKLKVDRNLLQILGHQ